MSKTGALWIIVCGLLTFLSLRRASWGAALYLFAFYFSPHYWWWGKDLTAIFGHRISLITALIFAATSMLAGPRLRPSERKVFTLLLFYALSATLVHLLFADNPERSWKNLNLLWKHLGLFYFLVTSVKDRQDWNILLYSIIIGSLHVGFAVVINDAGNMVQGRLELKFAAGVGDSNFLAGILSMALPMIGAQLFIGNRYEKMLSVVASWLVLDTVILANSRGGFLSLLVGGAWFFLNAKGRSRRLSFYVLGLGIVAGVVLLGDERIIERFKTAFDPPEKRESSAQSRIEFWKSALRMLNDYPYGLGGEAAFKSRTGAQYIAHLRAEGYVGHRRGVTGPGYRAVHNGYLDVLCGWGIQSVFFYLMAHFVAMVILRRATRYTAYMGDWRASFLGLCISTSLIIQYVNSFFISSLDGEWCFWLLAIALAYDRIYGEYSVLEEQTETTDNVEEEIGIGESRDIVTA